MKRKMRKLLLFVLIMLAIILGYSFGPPKNSNEDSKVKGEAKKEILRVGLVADSHNENELLAKALRQSKEMNVDLVIGLGDYTNLGTVEELVAAKEVFEQSGIVYHVIPGDRDGWASREEKDANYFEEIFGEQPLEVSRGEIQFVFLDNSNIYSGISQEDWEILNLNLDPSKAGQKLTFVFAHKTPYHPESKHIMGEDNPEVAKQAQELVSLMEEKKVDGFFSGDLHFFATYEVSPRIITKATEIDGSVALHNSAEFSTPGGLPQQSVRITTIGAVASERNFQGPRFGILKIFDDYSWEVEDHEIRI